MADLAELPPLASVLEEHRDEVLLCTMAFDGVLAEYQADPARVRLPAARRHRLRQLGGAPGVAVAIISGRRVADLESRAAIGPQAFYIGVHGMEITGPHYERIRRDLFDQYRDSLRRIADALEPVVARVDGVHLEERKPRWRCIRTTSIAATPSGCVSSCSMLRLTWSRPMPFVRSAAATSWSCCRIFGQPRTAAIDEVRRVLAERTGRPVFGVYVGPDVVDDDGREMPPSPGLSIVVGRRGGGCYHFATLDDVDHFVDELIVSRRGYHAVPSMA